MNADADLTSAKRQLRDIVDDDYCVVGKENAALLLARLERCDRIEGELTVAYMAGQASRGIVISVEDARLMCDLTENAIAFRSATVEEYAAHNRLRTAIKENADG